jgi:3' terminal RNA ribose 2'-O-methyltransferase Hen1
MLFTITMTYTPATDLGYLLHKHPARVQTFDLSFGQAHVFYPGADPERCTAALLLDIDPFGLVRNRRAPASHDFLLQPYVNDRPYVASSFLSVAIADVFGTALSGRCQARPELAATPLPLQARLAVLPCSGGESVLRRLFEPLGYFVTAEQHPLDARVPEWGDSGYFTVTLTGTLRLCDLLSHVYVLVPVLDDEKHYWIGDDEVAKLLRYGEGWLARHPERELIARRYLKHQRSLTDAALAQLADEDDADRDATDAQGGDAEDTVEASIGLQHQRLEAVLAALHARGVSRVLDLGCGNGTLVRLLLRDSHITEVVGMDVARRHLDRAAGRWRIDEWPPATSYRRRLDIYQWETIRDNYVGGTQAALDHVMREFRPDGSGQLLLWDGPPGTGKTSALRALIWQWRAWCAAEYIVDPEVLFGAQLSYLVSVLLHDNDDEGSSDEGEESQHPSRLLILEDSGEFLTMDAKERTGQALSRFLNVVDGLIGQGLRLLVLVTSNEALGKLHPAVSRPGRCVQKIRFQPFPPMEATAWLARHGEMRPMGEASCTLAELYTRLHGEEEGEQRPAVGFVQP